MMQAGQKVARVASCRNPVRGTIPGQDAGDELGLIGVGVGNRVVDCIVVLWVKV